MVMVMKQGCWPSLDLSLGKECVPHYFRDIFVGISCVPVNFVRPAFNSGCFFVVFSILLFFV